MGYLRFEGHPSQTGKTEVVSVYSVRSGDLLATISWFGRWRCYAFHPLAQTAWNTDCLKEIYGKIDSMMEQRRVGRD
jgi:hypothetical protein